ncbi:hypothetical protein KAJ27_09835, partial [bacterium]|nr:hypothetical protein [bacterium]
MRAADNNYTGDYATTGTFSWDFLRRIDDDTIATVPFSIDLNNPVGAITYPDQGSYHNSNFTINGTASDASGIKSIEIKFGTDAPIALTPIDIDGVNYTWSYNYTLIPDGQVTYQLIVTDNYDKIFTTDRYFTIDTTGPTIGFFQPSDGDTANGSLLLRGDATDTRLVNQVYVHISDDNAAVTGDPTNGDWTGWQLADGTFSWSHRIDTTAFADGPYDAHVRAVDGAGNISGDNILNINFDQTDNSPIFSQLNLTDSPSVNLFGTGGLITGTITDDDSVDASTIEIRFDINNDADFNDGGFENWASVTNQGTSGVNVSFSHDLDAAGLPESANEYPMQIRASDIGEAAYGIPSVMTTSSTFIAAVDRSPPSVSLTSISLLDRYTLLPRSISGVSMPGALLNNNFTLKSTISDPGGIASVLVSINGGSFVNTNITDIGDGTWDYAKSVDLATNTNDGNTTITVKAIDTWGRESTQSLTIVIDSTEPTVNYVEPANNSNVNGTVTVRGTTIDNGAIQSLSISGSALSPISFTNTGTDDSWFTTFDAYTYDNVTYSIGQGDGTWLFPITVTAVDSALNKTESIRNVYLDPDGDKPVIVDATLIPGDDSSVSGTIVLQSTVTDDDTPAYVRIFADLNDDGIITPSAYPIDLSDPANGDTLDPFEEEDNYLEVSISNGVWTALVNENSEFSKANLAARAVPSPTGYIQFHIVPYDSNGTQGNTSIRRVYIDATAPVIEGVNYSSGALVKGSITITGTIKDDVALNTDYIQISFNGGLNYQNLNINSGPTTVGDYQEYTFSETIDTDSAGFFPGSSGVLYTVIKVTDNTFKQSSLNLNFNVDNELPAVLFDSDPASLSFVIGSDPKIYTFDGNASISGSNFQVMGRSSDAGTVSGIDKINIYFVKDGNFESPKSAVAPAVAINSVLGDELYDQSGIVTSGVPFTENTNYLITIDNRLEQGQFDTVVGIGDQDGFEEELNTFNDWSAFFDTTVFPDGPLDIYYVVYDNSGNKTYASVKGQISNNPPSIDSIDVGGSNYTAEPMYQKVSGISLPIALNVSDAEGIDITGYKLTIANEYTIGGDGYPGTANVFTPVVFVDTDFITTTATEGTIAIDTTTLNDLWYHVIGETMDTHGNIVTMGFYLLADNNDLTGPVATIDPFTQSHEGGSGHIEEAENSPDADNQADLSGTVTITGTVRDDNSVTSLTLAISQGSFSDIGTAALTAASDGDPLNGEEDTWTYTWDTSTIAGVADEDVIIRATGNDGVNDSISPATLTVDIVPYITDILTGNDSGLRAYVKRSALGRYTISAESTVTIVGYNLAENTANSINIGGTLLNPTGSTGTTEQIVDLGIITTPGTLTVTTNGVSSRNNTNTNNLSQNMEASIYYPDHTDDRIISLWQITPHSDVTYQGLSDAVMEPNANRDGFDWMYVRNGKELWWYKGLSDATSKITEGNALKGGDFNFNTNGSLMFLFNHDNQWTSYADDYRFIGSVQWGAIPSSLTYYFNYQDDGTTYDGSRDESYNWNNNGKNASVPRVFPRLGLGNLSFLNNPTFGGGAAYYPAYNQLSLGRYKNLKMKTIGSNTINRNYVAYFDTGAGESRSIVFYGFKAGSGTGAAEVTTANTYYHITGTSANRIPLGHDWFATVDKYHTSAADATVALAGTQASNDTGLATPRGRMDVTGINSGANSEYFDLGVYEVNATTHYGYIAYYDEVSSSLKIISNTGLYTADPLNTGWT